MSETRLRAAACTGVVWLFAACASVPIPEAELADATTAMRAAERVNAAEQAPLEMRVAREKLDEARAATREGDNMRARRLAEEATVEAQVAEMKARAASAQEMAESIRKDIEALREEAQRTMERMR